MGATTVFSVRVPLEWLKLIDEARGRTDRNTWIKGLIERGLTQRPGDAWPEKYEVAHDREDETSVEAPAAPFDSTYPPVEPMGPIPRELKASVVGVPEQSAPGEAEVPLVHHLEVKQLPGGWVATVQETGKRFSAPNRRDVVRKAREGSDVELVEV